MAKLYTLLCFFINQIWIFKIDKESEFKTSLLISKITNIKILNICLEVDDNSFYWDIDTN